MKRRRRIGYQRAALTPEALAHLESGGAKVPVTEQALAVLWRQHRNEILGRWIVEHPGTRPWAWWQYDAPGELRLRVDRPGARDWPRNLRAAPSFGLPGLIEPSAKGSSSVVFESQAAYLDRHNLLGAGERAKLTEADLEPERFDA